MRGRVSSLLEVGTGFHPEMTGRENIYMNGNILGMSNSEINKKLNDIIDFSGVGQFLETPVKRYSSGMQTRLAFAVAAHLEPEILIIDEVLAVGDAEFQKKCLGKMEEIGNSGRTILFVSHNMNAIKNLCNRCIWLKDGAIVREDKNTHEVVKFYMEETVPSNASTTWECPPETKLNTSHVDFKSFKLMDQNGHSLGMNIFGNDEVYVMIEFMVKESNQDLQVGFALYDTSMNLLFMSYHNDKKGSCTNKIKKGKNKIITKLPTYLLNDGEYTLQLIAGIRGDLPILTRADSEVTISFALNGNFQRSNTWDMTRPSLIAPILEWESL